MRMRVACAAVAGALTMASGAASAQTEAYTSTPVYLYAGPAQDYPIVAQLPAGQPVTVYGCVSGYTWCDVAIPQARGWVYGGDLAYPYQGSNVPVMTYGTALGLPLITFSLGTYWGHYYRERPWYPDRSRWEHHAPPPNRPLPPGHPPPPQGANRPPPASPRPEPAPQPPGAEHGHRPGPPQPPPGQRGEPQPGQGARPPGPPPGQMGAPAPGHAPAQGGRPPGPPAAPPPARPAGPPPAHGGNSAPRPPEPPGPGNANH
ncbi:SH3 domain-containing protein [Paraburkholderia phymatum]|uniref:SH3 type 3 domain protein n=1 Tax=Paraburkholderia phymatum (strain DSM 17167 / CIP 108236 / LMG 21445 / STM815) TaxID=391038 RepID=B2JGN6_PARP8|nr:SH3 domain-containing protein [Paraburkholderia phymatum]ACC70221.1 SH3 type 3 domain protein [Paraburkholderia phymatum STM815]